MNLKYLHKIDTTSSGLSFIHAKFCIITEVSLADSELVKNFVLQFLSNNTAKIRKFTASPFVWAMIQIVLLYLQKKSVWSMLRYILRMRGQGGSLKQYKLHTPQYNLNIYSNPNIQDQ